MAFKGSGPLLFALLAVVCILEVYAADYRTFMRQHYNFPLSSIGGNYCDAMMQRRRMTSPQCKNTNSFIHAPRRQIVAVCSRGQPVNGNQLRRSRTQFSVTTCKLKGGSTRPPCRYRQNRSQRFIVIACRGGKPVHYEEGQI